MCALNAASGYGWLRAVRMKLIIADGLAAVQSHAVLRFMGSRGRDAKSLNAFRTSSSSSAVNRPCCLLTAPALLAAVEAVCQSSTLFAVPWMTLPATITRSCVRTSVVKICASGHSCLTVVQHSAVQPSAWAYALLAGREDVRNGCVQVQSLHEIPVR